MGICTYVHIFLRSPVDPEYDPCNNQSRRTPQERAFGDIKVLSHPGTRTARTGFLPDRAQNSSQTQKGEQLG